ncbi:helix-turn-helix domain-containing protein [Candidatus Saccharibacteria bacterium]|nr:helix-turn-helix domain-containing protein [Candidatus Saccharibacteria bacterium]
MKSIEKQKAIRLREQGYSIKAIAQKLNVAKSSVSLWVREIKLDDATLARLKQNPHSTAAVEKRRITRLDNEERKRQVIISDASKDLGGILNYRELWIAGVALYWAEGGKTRRLLRFSNGDPAMIRLMMDFFRKVCEVPEAKFRGYIHIHPNLDALAAEQYWSTITGIPLTQFFKTYRKPNISSKGKRQSLPHGVLDIYVLDTQLFYRMSGWIQSFTSAALK